LDNHNYGQKGGEEKLAQPSRALVQQCLQMSFQQERGRDAMVRSNYPLVAAKTKAHQVVAWYSPENKPR